MPPSSPSTDARPDAPPPGPRLARAIEILGSKPAFAVAVVLAVLVRLVHLRGFQHSPLADNPVLDNQAYVRWAQQIAAGDWLSRSRGAFWVDPLYPYALAVLFSLFDRHLYMVRGLQCALGIIDVYLTRTLARRISGSDAIAHAAAFVAALFMPALHNEMQTEKSALTTTLCTAALSFFLRGSPTQLLTAGVLTGLAVLARGNLLLMVPAGVILLLASRSSPAPDAWPPERARIGPWQVERTAIANALRFGLSAMAIVGVVTVRNAYVAHDFVLTTSNGGQNLYIGQFAGNTWGVYTPPPFVRPDPDHEEMDFRAEAESQTGHPMRASQVTAFWAREAIGAMIDAPGATATRSFRKLRLVFHEFETPDADDVDVVADYSWVLRMPFFWMGQLAPFAFIGAWVTWKRSRDARIAISAVGIYVATLVLFFVLARFRLPITPVVIVFACIGGAWLIDRVRAWDLSRAGAGLAVVGVLGFVFLDRPDWMEDLRRASLAVAYNNLAVQAMQAGDDTTAIAVFERAIETNPTSVVGSMRSLGDLYLRRHDYDNAERVMLRVLENRPNSSLGRQALVHLYETMAADPRYAHDQDVQRRLAEAYRAAGRGTDAARVTALRHGEAAEPAHPLGTPSVTHDQTHATEDFNRAMEARRAGHWPEAIAALQEAIRIGDYNEDWRYTLGAMMTNHATPQEAIQYFSTAVASDPKPQTSMYFWALALERTGDLHAALAKLDEVLAVDPAHEMSELRECVLYERLGDLTRAMAHCDLAVEIFPDFRAAHEERARILRTQGHADEAAHEDTVAARSDPNTPRRFVYWARYLMRRGRYTAAVPEIQRALDQNANDPEALRLMTDAHAHLADAAVVANTGSPREGVVADTGPAATASAPGTGDGFDAHQTEAILQTLRSRPPGVPAWIAAYPGDTAGMARARTLAALFAQAGWSVRPIQLADRALRPGITIYGADEQVPTYVGTVQTALQAAGFTIGINGGYRAYYTQAMETRPGFHGFGFGPDQTYLVVVGPPG